MGCRTRYGTAGATGGGESAQPGSIGYAFGETAAQPRFSYQQRSPKTWRDRNRWASLWPMMGIGAFGGGAGGGTDGMPLPIPGFEPFSCDGEGTQSIKWIMGECLDASGNPAAGAVVQCFRTSDDAFTGEVNANSTDGRFAVPTPWAGVNHYLVAYKPGSPDVGGTTVNTLVPTNIDGT